MTKISELLKLFFAIAKTQAVMNRKFDSYLGGLGLNDLLVLFYIDQSFDGRVRRADLAEKLGLTASGVTRLLLPMEKIGLVKRELDETDARVSFVSISTSGRVKLHEGLERAEMLMDEVLPRSEAKKVSGLRVVLDSIR
jgi:DNA-binding MarR family transcriptional regulator